MIVHKHVHYTVNHEVYAGDTLIAECSTRLQAVMLARALNACIDSIASAANEE